MIWFKSLLVGIAAAIVTGIAAGIAVPILMLQVMMWAHIGEGSGGIGAYSSGVVEFFILPVIAFALAFWWSVRRARRKRATIGA
jgi:uncharacterized membrane protein